MVSPFYKKLLQKIILSLRNEHKDNFDVLRYGKKTADSSFAGKIYNSKFVNDRFFNKSNYISILNKASDALDHPDFDKLDWLYNRLNNAESQDLMIDIIAYRILGHTRVKLPANTPQYWIEVEKCIQLEHKVVATEENIPGLEKLGLFDLAGLGYDLRLRFGALGVLLIFRLEQYKYQSGGIEISAKPGDVVIDAGGCWGDTALYFASKVGDKGKVYSYEFIPNNLRIFRKNLSMNPAAASRIEIVERPLWDKAGTPMYYVDNGPGSSISFEPLEGKINGEVKTYTIDAQVKDMALEKVNFIKMDIEGAEPFALKGAEETIRKHRPKLAITIYHSIEDFMNIPEYIDSLNLGYKFFIGHNTIFEEETVLFATI